MGDHHRAADALGAGGGQPSILADQGAETIEDAVAHAIGEDEIVDEEDVALFVGQADMAGCGDLVVILIIGDAVGQQDAALVVDLDMADGRNGLFVAIVIDAVGPQPQAREPGRPFGRGMQERRRARASAVQNAVVPDLRRHAEFRQKLRHLRQVRRGEPHMRYVGDPDDAHGEVPPAVSFIT